MRPGRATVGHPVDVATGVMHTRYDDLYVPGKVPLNWERFYSTALATERTPLGIGWRNRYFCALTYRAGEFRFTEPTGGEVLLHDPYELLREGGAVRNLGAFTELTFADNSFTICQWDVETGEVWRYLFDYDANANGQKISPLQEIHDPTGHGLALEYQTETGRLVGIRQNLEQRALSLVYSDPGMIEAVEFVSADRSRHTLFRYAHDAHGRLVSARDAVGQTNRFEYDAKHCLVREYAKDGAVTSFAYDAEGRCIHTYGLNGYDEKRLRFIDNAGWTEVTDSLGYVCRYQRNGNGQILREINALNAEYLAEYDEYGRILTKTNPMGAEIRFVYDGMGNRCTIVNALGQRTESVYNASHLPVSYTDPAGNTWSREYDSANRLTAMQDPEGNRYRLTYDNDGNLTAVTDPLGHQLRQGFDGKGALHSATDWAGHVTRYTADAFGRLVERIDPLGAVTRYQYDRLGNLIGVAHADGTNSSYGCDAAGNLTSITDRNGHVTRYEYAPGRRLIKRTNPMGDTVQFSWGTEPNRLMAITNGRGEVCTFDYDALGRITGETGFDGRTLGVQYDLAGNRIASTNGLGERIEYRRDILGRLTEQVLPNGDETRFEYDSAGYVLAAVNRDSEVRFVRNRLGRIVRETQDGHRIERCYDAVGNLKSLKTSLGHEIAYRFDANGWLAGFERNGRERHEIERDARGLEVKRSLPGGAEIHQRLDELGRPLDQTLHRQPVAPTGMTGASPAALVHRNYWYDKAQLAEIKDSHWGSTRYVHDPAQRLLDALRDQGVSESFLYDANDNIVRIVRDGQAETLTYAQGDRLIGQGDTERVYDAQGRQIRKVEPGPNGTPREWRYSWDALDQLREVTNPDGETWQYSYDGFGRRTAKRSPQGTVHGFVWNGNVVLHELNNGTLAASWTFDPHSFTPLCKYENREVYSIISNYLGTPKEMVDQFGTIVWRSDHDAWGQAMVQVGSTAECPVRFQGHWYDAESGLHYNHFRYYCPQSGYYLSQDILGVNGGLNQYAYCRNPVLWIDPLGLVAEYYPRDELGRPTGAFADVTASDLRPTGSSPPSVDPPGWQGGSHPHHQQRSHLIADTLGGSGSDRGNIVALTDGTNHPGMSREEGRIRRHVRNGNRVLMEVVPVYDGNNTEPVAVRMYAIDQNGDVIVDETIANGRRQNTSCCN